jgi:hypothetical protein
MTALVVVSFFSKSHDCLTKISLFFENAGPKKQKKKRRTRPTSILETQQMQKNCTCGSSHSQDLHTKKTFFVTSYQYPKNQSRTLVVS